MSATVTDDAFLVKGLELTPETIMKPLTYSKETLVRRKDGALAISDS